MYWDMPTMTLGCGLYPPPLPPGCVNDSDAHHPLGLDADGPRSAGIHPLALRRDHPRSLGLSFVSSSKRFLPANPPPFWNLSESPITTMPALPGLVLSTVYSESRLYRLSCISKGFEMIV